MRETSGANAAASVHAAAAPPRRVMNSRRFIQAPMPKQTAQRHFVRSRTPASAARAPATTLGVSSAASLPPRLRMRPSTTTVSTFSGPVASSTRCAGSVTTAMLSAFGLIAIRSARLPGLSEPILSSNPIELERLARRHLELALGLGVLAVARELEHGEQVRAPDQRRGVDRDAERNTLGQHLTGLRIAIADEQFRAGRYRYRR